MLQHVVSPGMQFLQSQAAHLVKAAPCATDFDYAAAVTQVDQDVLQIIAQAFVDLWPRDYEKMQAALAAGDLLPVLHVAHALKGTLAMFGAKPASDLAGEIERCAGGHDSQGAELRLALLALEMDKLIPVIPLLGPD